MNLLYPYNSKPFIKIDHVNADFEEIHYSHNDNLLVPLILTDQDRNVVWQAVRTPFGEIVEEEMNGQVVQWRGYLGQDHDREAATDYNYYRDYDPRIGRYVQSDPIGLDGGINTYTYVMGNPIKYTDRFGLELDGSWGDSLPGFPNRN